MPISLSRVWRSTRAPKADKYVRSRSGSRTFRTEQARLTENPTSRSSSTSRAITVVGGFPSLSRRSRFRIAISIAWMWLSGLRPLPAQSGDVIDTAEDVVRNAY